MMRILPLLLVLSTAVPAASQVQLGIRAGVSVATLAVYEDEPVPGFDFDDRIGFTGGVTAELPFAGNLALRTELVYTTKGARREEAVGEVFGGEAADVTLEIDYAFDYVELPVLLVVSEPDRYVELAVFAGPTFSLNVREAVDGRAHGAIDGVPITEEQAAMLIGPPPDDGVTTADVGATLGTRAVRGRLTLEARFTLGLPTVSGGETDGTRFIDVKNRAFAVSIGYAL